MTINVVKLLQICEGAIRLRNLLTIIFLLTATHAVAETLDANTIKSQLIGPSITWWSERGEMKGEMTLSPSGEAHITINAPQPASDDGHWSLEGNQLCTVWSTMRQGIAKCYTLRETTHGHFLTSGGNEFALQAIAV